MLEFLGLLDYLLRRVEMRVHLIKLLLLHHSQLLLSLLRHFEFFYFPKGLMINAVGLDLGKELLVHAGSFVPHLGFRQGGSL